MGITVYGISTCDTCRKARAFLDGQGTRYTFHDLRRDGLDAATVRRWLGKADRNTLLNRRSTTWRQLSGNDQERAAEETLPDLLVEHPTLIKRPVLESGDLLLVGFRESDYAALR